MKKTILFIGLIIVILAIGFYIFVFSNPVGEEEEAITEPEEQTQPLAEEEEQTSILAWLQGGKGVECTVQTAEGEINVKTRDNKVRVFGIDYFSPDEEEATAEQGEMLTIDDWLYIWSEDEGFKYNLKTLEEMSQESENVVKDYSWQNMAQQWEDDELEYDCEETRIPDDTFIPPSNIDFVDWTETMQKIQQMGEELSEELDEGEVINQEDIEKYLEEAGVDTMMRPQPE